MPDEISQFDVVDDLLKIKLEVCGGVGEGGGEP